MSDRYADFASLAAAHEEGREYRIRVEDRGAPVVVLAPHGGTIEPETDTLAEAIAGDDHSFYAFEVLIPSAQDDFHITSHRFDEPRALALVGASRRAVALHGRRDDGTRTVWLGGRDSVLRDRIGEALRAAGFDAAPNPRLPGVHETNICNRTRTGQGVQLELPRSLRHELADSPALFERFVAAVRAALA